MACGLYFYSCCTLSKKVRDGGWGRGGVENAWGHSRHPDAECFQVWMKSENRNYCSPAGSDGVCGVCAFTVPSRWRTGRLLGFFLNVHKPAEVNSYVVEWCELKKIIVCSCFFKTRVFGVCVLFFTQRPCAPQMVLIAQIVFALPTPVMNM